MRRSADRPDAYEIQCIFLALDNQDGVLSAWAPFEQLGQLVSGAVFDSGRLSGVLGMPRQLQTNHFMPIGTAVLRPAPGNQPIQMIVHERGDHTSEYHVRSVHRSSVEPWALTQEEPPVCIGQDRGRQVFIPSGELLRFYFGPLSLGSHAFMTAAHASPGEDLVDLDHTGLSDDGVFHIAPNEGLADRGSALHLAMLLASESLKNLWANTALGISLAHGRNDVAYPVAIASEDAPSLQLSGRQVQILSGFLDNEQPGFMASRVLSDRRRAPFKSVVVRLPRGLADLPEDVDLSQLSESDRRRALIQPVLAFDNRRRPGISAIRRSTMFQSVLSAFPGLAGVKITYEHGGARSRKGLPLITSTPVEVGTLSMLPQGDANNTGALVLRPSRTAGTLPTIDERPQRALFTEHDMEPAAIVAARVLDLTFPLSTFVQAFVRLSRVGVGALLFQDPLVDGAMLLQAPPSWDLTRRDSRPRRMAVGMITTDEGRIHVFELERLSHRERISLALIARPDGEPMSLHQMSAVFRYALRRLREHGCKQGQGRGIWPTRGFSDVVGRVASHTRKRSFASCMAEDLDDVARTLFAFRSAD